MPDDKTIPPTSNSPGTSVPPGGKSPTGVGTGTRIMGTYEIEQLISKGGMGEVYRGRNIHTGDPVAIKIVLPHLAQDEMIIQLFQKEAKVLGRLASDAIVRYHVFTNDPLIGRPSLIMEFVEGTSMNDRLKQGPMSLTDVRTLLARLASGLDKAHGVGVVHRDLSPDNVILEGGFVEHAKIIDFGIAKSSMKGDATLLQGQFAGKFSYVAPEQLGAYGGVVDQRTDIYSLALMMVAASQGRILNMGKSIVEAVRARGSVPDLSAVYPEIRPLLEHMLEPDPEHRPASMAEVIRLLDDPDSVPGRPDPSESMDPDRTIIASSLPPTEISKIGRSMPPQSSLPGRSTVPRGQTAPPSAPDMFVGIPDQGSKGAVVPEKTGGKGGLIAAVLVLLVAGGGGGAWMSGMFDPKPAPEAPQTTAEATPSTETPAASTETPAAETPPATETASSEPTTPPTPTTEAPPAQETVSAESTTTPETTAEPATPPAAETTETVATEPVAEPPAPELGTVAAQVDWLRKYQTPACVYLGTTESSGDKVSIEGFGQSVDPFARLLADFTSAHGVEPDIGVRLINDPQCPVLDFMNAARDTAGLPATILLDNKLDVLKSGEAVIGRIEGLAGRSAALFLVNGPGGATNLKPWMTTESDGSVSFSFTVSLAAGADPTPQLLLAVITDQPLSKLDAVPNGVTARALVPFMQAELARARLKPIAALRYFRLEN